MDITKNSLFSLYFHELGWLTSAIKKNCEAIFAETPIPDEGYYIKVQPELHALIESVLMNAGHIRKLLHTSEKRYKNESVAVYNLRQKRSKILRETLSGVKLEEILNNKLRNSLEHFDEYLDENIVRLTEKGPPPATHAAYNMVLSHREIFKPQVYPIRLYIAGERKFYNMRFSIDIGKIHAEAAAILKRLHDLGIFPVSGPGGVMIPLRFTASE
jgi:hypothetical protein